MLKNISVALFALFTATYAWADASEIAGTSKDVTLQSVKKAVGVTARLGEFCDVGFSGGNFEVKRKAGTFPYYSATLTPTTNELTALERKYKENSLLFKRREVTSTDYTKPSTEKGKQTTYGEKRKLISILFSDNAQMLSKGIADHTSDQTTYREGVYGEILIDPTTGKMVNVNVRHFKGGNVQRGGRSTLGLNCGDIRYASVANTTEAGVQLSGKGSVSGATMPAGGHGSNGKAGRAD